jgi:hypothetical protein
LISCSETRIDREPKHRESGGAESGIFASDVFGIVWCFERLAGFPEWLLDSSDCFAHLDSAEASIMNSFIRDAIVIQEQVAPGDSVLLLVDPVR